MSEKKEFCSFDVFLWFFFLLGGKKFFLNCWCLGQKKRFMFPVTCPKWKFRVDRHQPFFFLPFFSPRSQKPHQTKKMLTFRTFLFQNCLQNLHIFIFVLESPHQMKKILTFRTILFRNCLQISQFFIFVLKSRKKRLGSGGFRD